MKIKVLILALATLALGSTLFVSNGQNSTDQQASAAEWESKGSGMSLSGDGGGDGGGDGTGDGTAGDG